MPLLLLAQAVAPPTPAQQRDVVVTARRPIDTARALDECMARKCPPKEDIRATLLHAESQYLDGDYRGARSTLLAGRRRNARYAEIYPIEVGDLLRANAKLASVNGFTDAARIGEIDTLDALKEGLPKSDSNVLVQRLRVGDSFARNGRLRAASDVYEAVARQAERSHQPAIWGQAMLKVAVLYGAIASVQPGYSRLAEKAMSRIARTTDPALEPYRDGVMLLRAKLAKDVDRNGAIDQAIAAMRARTTTVPVLIYAPPIKLPSHLSPETRVLTIDGSSGTQWADVSFWIAPDGTVRDVDVLRQSPNREGAWLDAVVAAVRGRRYAPLTGDGSSGAVRIERYSLVSDLVWVTGTRMAQRMSNGRLEMDDLTAASAPK